MGYIKPNLHGLISVKVTKPFVTLFVNIKKNIFLHNSQYGNFGVSL